MTMQRDTTQPAGGSPVDRGVGRPVPERDNVYVGGAERASESNSRHPADGDPYATAHTRHTPHADYPCRHDGRCQYAIDSGAEGLGHCPRGKCVMPEGEPQ